MINIQGYLDSEAFLADRLIRVFQHIDTDEKRLEHNDMIRDLRAIVGEETLPMRKDIARMILSRRRPIKRSFVKRVAQIINDIGVKRNVEKTVST
jgi:hypothetical protein